jgi:transposase
MISDKIEAFLGDKGYDSDAIREELAKAEVEAVIPAKSNRKSPAPHDREKYRWRNLVERLFNKLKNWRRVATRYDKTKESYLGFVAIASIKLWIPFVHETYICLRLLEGADIYQVAKNWRTSVEMIEKYYGRHLTNNIDASAVNVRKVRPAPVAASKKGAKSTK